jgi:hypothetical protein
VSAVNLLVAYDMEEIERCYSSVLDTTYL